MNSLFIDVPSPGEKLGKMLGDIPRPGVPGTDNKSRKATRSASVIRASWKRGSWTIWYTNMAGNFKLKISLKVVNEGEVVELIRRRYIQNKIYVSNIFTARARFLFNSC